MCGSCNEAGYKELKKVSRQAKPMCLADEQVSYTIKWIELDWTDKFASKEKNIRQYYNCIHVFITDKRTTWMFIPYNNLIIFRVYNCDFM